jgi:four helix bundle protein
LFPREEVFGLTSQMRRAAVSVASNIAEGKGRNSRRELSQFLYMARGSLLELETQIQIARDLDYLDEAGREHLATQVLTVVRPLNGLIAKIRDEQ